MSRVLSQEEIDALLSTAATSRGDAPLRPRATSNVVAYNFRRPDRISKEQLRSLHFLHDRFALNVSTSLSAFLRSMTEVSIVSVEQVAYSEFLLSLPDPTAFYALSLQPLEGIGALEMNPHVAFTMVDRMLGGTGAPTGLSRALTEIEQNVIDSVVKLILENLAETWKSITPIQFRIQGRETRPQMLQVTGPNEIVILLVFDIKLADTRGMFHLCIPASAIEAVRDSFAAGWQRSRRDPNEVEAQWLQTNLGRVQLPVTALLETVIPARELLALERGDILALGQAAETPVDVCVGELRRFGGRLARQGSGAVGVLVQTAAGVEEPEGAIA